MSNYTLTDTVLSTFHEAHAELREKQDTDLVKAIILLGSGWSATDVAEAFLIDRNTTRTYCRNIRKGGLGILLQTKHVGIAPVFYRFQKRTSLINICKKTST
jgi:hypothetical protein